MFYFAYGSNMEHRLMLEERCPGSEFVGRAILDGYWMVYDGFSPSWGGALANIAPSRQDEVWGGLYEITEEHLAKIDSYEGCPRHYQRSLLDVLRSGGKGKVQAWVYYRQPQAVGVPSRRYLEALVQGARDCGLPEDYIRSVINVLHQS
jgi:gamma-glutamylcyclotransferase